MGDLAKAAIKHYAPLAGKDPSEVKIQFIGKREGEKDHESLLAEHELKMAMETENMLSDNLVSNGEDIPRVQRKHETRERKKSRKMGDVRNSS